MDHNWSVTFLGTSSGGGPSESRNCSSLITNVVGDGSLWMVDCAEGTLRQFALQPHRQHGYLKASRLTKMFITHMHADHIMGIVPILRNILFPPLSGDESRPKQPPRIEIYGPAGIRAFVRTVLRMTLTRTSDRYVVHELLTPGDGVTPCVPEEVMHSSEAAGRDIWCSDEVGFWKEFTEQSGVFGTVMVDAGPISHRDPCIGYIIRESSAPFRKLVILGDTHDPSTLIPLATSPSPSLLIHEATDAYIPRKIDPNARRTPEAVKEKALVRGHSIPAMAGAFAKKVGAKRLVLNHIGGRFPAPGNKGGEVRAAVMREIERQASAAWGMGQAVAASDFMHVVIAPPHEFSGQAGTNREARYGNLGERKGRRGGGGY